MRRTLALATTVLLFGGGIALAGPASAHDSRTHTCASQAATMTNITSVGYNATTQRCVIVKQTTSAPVASGTINWDAPTTRPVGDPYAGDLVTYEQGELVDTIIGSVNYGEWVDKSTTTSTPVTSKAGKSTNTKFVTTTTTIQERTVSTSVTYVYETFEITYLYQDVEQVRDGSESTTVTTTTTTYSYRYGSGANTNNFANSNTANPNPVVSGPTDSTSAGDPILYDDVVVEGSMTTVEAGTESVEVTPTEENGGIVAGTQESTATQEIITTDTCVANKNKSKNRGNCTP